MHRQKKLRIPTILALLFILISMVSGIYLVENFPSLFGKAASLGINPQDVRISKVTDSSFVVSWITLDKTAGFIRYAHGGDLNKTAYDVRDQNKTPKTYKTHYVEVVVEETLKNITFEVVSGAKTFPQPQEIILGPKIIEPAQALPVYGELKTKEGAATEGAIIYLSLKDASPWSYFVSQSQKFVLPLANLRTYDLQSFYCQARSCAEETEVKIEIYAEEDNSQVLTLLGNARPFPEPIILGRDYAGPLSSPPLSAPQVYGEKTKSKEKELKIEILAPDEGAALPFEKPLIRGLGIPGEEVLITLESAKQQEGKVEVDKKGFWFWTPKDPLSPGKHELTVKTQDSEGNKVTLKRHFFVLKSGESVLAGSTPSATLTPTTLPATPTLTPTLTSTPNPTPSPTLGITATPTLPPSGFFLPTFLFLLSGFSLLLLGLTTLRGMPPWY